MSSKGTFSRRSLLKGAAVGSGALLLGKTAFGHPPDGPSTAVRPYVVPSVPGVHIKPILTTGDAIGGYHMVGIPDGLGAIGCGPNFELFMNHEITSGAPGIVRAHGSAGAFVSKWTIDRSTLKVLEGEDLTKSGNDIHQWNGTSYFTGTTLWQRLCSADLPDEKALRHGHLGTPERMFFNGEEITFGRAWARIVTGPNAGQAWELPRLGKMSFENVVACPHGKEQTIVAMFD
ncbi:MAG TPA: twin-arginine translocation signal domain-containing protein, partial [Terriglobia bacterium]|nr:twin-arginine translocation signal domain-containing protein [Terriglobia bacterium]